MIQSKFAWKNGWQERERKKEKLLLEKKTVRKCRGCLTCVQQFVTIWFAMDLLSSTVGWQNRTYTMVRTVPDQLLVWEIGAPWRFCKKLIQISNYFSFIGQHSNLDWFLCADIIKKMRLLTRLFFWTNKMMMSSL